MFPDAVTERGTRHALALAEMAGRGLRTGILFVCQRSDAKLFRPMWDRDPGFAQALVAAEKAGVEINVITAEVTPSSITYHSRIPYDLTPFLKRLTLLFIILLFLGCAAVARSGGRR